MNEKEKDIRQLLDRFMAGETSLEEEALLGEWFRQHPDVSDDLKEYQMMFGYSTRECLSTIRQRIMLQMLIRRQRQECVAYGCRLVWLHPSPCSLCLLFPG